MVFLICYPRGMKVGKSKKDVLRHLGVRVPAALHRQLVQAAVADRRSLIDEIIVLLESALARRK